MEYSSKNYKTIVVLLITTIIFQSCWTEKKIERFKKLYCKGETTHSDSTVTTTTTIKTPHDSTFYLDKINSLTNAIFECDKNGQVRLKSLRDSVKNSKVEVTVIPHGNNSFTFQCKIDSQAVSFKYYNEHTTTNIEHKTKDSEKIIVKVEKPYSQWVSFRLIGFWVGWGLIFAYLAYLWLKKKFNIVNLIKNL